MNMKRTNRISLTLGALFAAGALAAGCAETDIVAKVAKTSFKALLEASPGRVAFDQEEGAWGLSSPGGDRVFFAADFSRNGGEGQAADMDMPDVEFTFDVAPFLAAGLDPSKLVGAEGLRYEVEDDELMLHFELGSDAFAATAKDSLEAAFAEIVRSQRARLGYHAKLDHYGIKLGEGNMLEWAKDLSTNDKDLVFVLNPEPLIAAGLDPAQVSGWAYAQVEMEDEEGKTISPWKLLRPFDL